MRLTRLGLFLVLGACVSIALAKDRYTSAAQSVAGTPIYIEHITVVDTESGKEAEDQTVIISGTRISELRHSGSERPPAKARVVQGRGKFLIPGLWDMHVHSVFAERLDSMFPMFVANGVLGIRDMGTSMPFPEIDQVRQQVTNGSRLGPRIIVAGPILDGRPTPIRANFLAITTPELGREAVRSLKAKGSDFIKIYSWLSREAFLAIADKANRHRIPFSGHVPFSVSALEASDAGQKSMEHLFGIYLSCSSREDELRSEMLKAGDILSGSQRIRLEVDEAAASYDERKAAKVFARLAKNGTWQVPTFVAVLPDSQGFDLHVTTDLRLKYIPPAVQKQWSEAASAGSAIDAGTFERKLQIVDAMHRAGVPLLAGTDTAWYQPYTYAGFSLHDELMLLVRAGLTPLEALRTATVNPAVFLGLEKDFGTVARGKLADVVLLDADPLLDIGNTRKIDTVVVGGRILDRKALDSLLADAEKDSKNR